MVAVGHPSTSVLGRGCGESRAGVPTRHVRGHGIGSASMWPPPLSMDHPDGVAGSGRCGVVPDLSFHVCFPAVVYTRRWGMVIDGEEKPVVQPVTGARMPMKLVAALAGRRRCVVYLVGGVLRLFLFPLCS